ncbi:MAG: hypothetical protein OXC95_06495 [Dehalococcoidia bacterium]|nr:hypothetical protein [Dehalococcoidia bacterium]
MKRSFRRLRRKRKKLIVFGIVLIGITFVFVVAWPSKGNFTPPLPGLINEAEQAPQVDAGEIQSAYDTNPVDWDVKYEGKRIAIVGVVASVSVVDKSSWKW